jgi:hypothetical protein
LRDILAAQRSQIANSQRIIDDLTKTVEVQAADSKLYRQHLAEWKQEGTAFSLTKIIRALTLAGIVLLLAYVVFFGMKIH